MRGDRAMSWLKPTNAKRILFFLLSDALFSLLSLFLAYQLRFNFHVPSQYWSSFFKIYLLVLPLKFLFLHLFGQYRFTWRYYGLYEAKRLLLALLGAYGAAFFIVGIAYRWFIPFPRSALLIDLFLSLLFLLSIRMAKRLWQEAAEPSSYKRAAIYGLGGHTKRLIDAFLSGEFPYKPIVVIEPKKESHYISGIPIIQSLRELPSDIQTLIVATKLSPKELDRLTQEAKQIGIDEVKLASLTQDKIKDIEIEDLLARNPKDLDKEAIKNFIHDKVVLITGAGGSIGSELVRQCSEYGAKEIIAVEMSEYNLYQLTEKEPNIVAKLCDVTNKEEFESIVQEFRPDIVLHAAAYKHVPLAELNPRATVLNNILGTKNVLDTAIKYKVPHFVLISTDKAVNPTNVMGATKRVCELYTQNVPSHKTTVCAVRFGNVLGSSGSVIPKFKEQIKKGGPLTVTHPEITRYFMLTSEACQLVLQAGAIAKGKEIFILDMGKPVKIVDLAKKMMQIYNKEVPIKFIGLRPGEKLYEELLLEGAEEPTKYESIFIAKPSPYDFTFLQKALFRLFLAKEPEQIIKELKTIVPEFNHTPHR